jgi:hypothetical protein
MADMEMAESTVTRLARLMIAIPCQIPACPTTHVRRRNNMVPQMLSRQRISTPSTQPNLITFDERTHI